MRCQELVQARRARLVSDGGAYLRQQARPEEPLGAEVKRREIVRSEQVELASRPLVASELAEQARECAAHKRPRWMLLHEARHKLLGLGEPALRAPHRPLLEIQHVVEGRIEPMDC
jgi:hypothetical protein